MRVPVAWLGDFMELPEDPQVIAKRLTEVGLESTLARAARVPEGVVTARIVECTKHPNAERLVLCRVDAGDGTSRTIVCGAPNARAGAVGALALPGAVLDGGIVIAERTMRGVLSQGMLCSPKELGLSADASGLLLLPESTAPGLPLARVLERELILETEPAANRGDWLAVEGIARELAAAIERPWTPKAPRVPAPKRSTGWSVAIEDASECPRYSGRVLEGVRLAPSPSWIAERLEAAGHRSISNLVDVTNWVLLELGHPLHAFDLDRLQGRTIGVRRARAGERLVTLDGKERELSPAVLAITDSSGPIALAGIMGGAPTAVGESTGTILIEGASFQAARVRAGTRALRMTSDASSRFERGVDPHGVARALDRAVEMLLEVIPGARLVESFDEFPAPPPARRVTLTKRNLRRILGIEIPSDRVRTMLERLELHVESQLEGGWMVRVPSFRRDVLAEEDLIEEVTRGYGAALIPERSRSSSGATPFSAPRWDREQRSRRCLLSAGFTEVVTPGLVDGASHAALLPDDGFFGPGVPVRNPLSADRDRLRGSLVPGLLEVLATNRARSTTDLALFEVGRAFRARPEGGVAERARAAVLLAGAGAPVPWIGATKPSDFFDMKGILEVYVEQLVGETLRVVTSSFAPLSGDRSARAFVGAREIGRLGDVGARARKSFDLPEDLPVFWAEWDLDDLEGRETAGRLYEPLPRFPGAVRDLAFVVSRFVTHESLETCLRDSGGPLLASIRLFDAYEGPPLGEDEKSLAYTIVFRDPGRSLTNDEVDALVGAIVDRAKREVGARLR